MSVLGTPFGLAKVIGYRGGVVQPEIFLREGGICHRLKKISKKKACPKHCISHFSSLSFVYYIDSDCKYEKKTAS